MIPPILITGCARSGTSLIAGAISLCGAFGGNVTGPLPHNQKGQFENDHIRDKIVKPYLKSISCDPLGQNPLPKTDDLKPVQEWNTIIEEVINKEGYETGPWYYKGAKMCLLWPIWHAAFPDAKWVIIRRGKYDIASSCLRTSFMRAYNDIEGWSYWVEHHERCFNEMKASGMNYIEVSSSDVVLNPNVLRKTTDFLDLDWNNEIHNFVTPSLWNKGNVIPHEVS